ncbi:MAG: acyl-CoA dehydrogenase family protein [Sphingomicrobium sp.]
MDFNPSDLQRMLLDSAERYLRERFTLDHRRSLRSVEDGLDRDAWAMFAELGWLALAIPEAAGGLGGSIDDIALLSTALGANLVTEPFVSTAVLAVHLLANASPAREDVLGRIAAGDCRIALAHDEPGEPDEDDADLSTIITREDDALTLTGRKMLVLDAPSADSLIVTASLGDERSMVLVLVDSGASGVHFSPYSLIDGSRAADIRFDAVRLGADAILAGPATARGLLAEATDRATMALLGKAVGSMEACLRFCSAYLKERHQFGQPIGGFQALQHIMADMFVATHQSRSALYQALSNADSPAAERGRAVSLAKLVVAEASQLVSRQGIQLHGGYGVTDEYEISHHYRQLLVIEKSFGDILFHTRRLAAVA